MFRVSPWINYAPDGVRSADDTQHESLPSVHNNSRERNSDDDMDAPQISTLREEHSPPATPAIQSEQPRLQTKFRVKLKLPSDPSAASPTTTSSAGSSSTNSSGGSKSGSSSNAGPGSTPGTTSGLPRPAHTIKVPGGRADPFILHSHTSSARTIAGADSDEEDDEEQEEEEEDQLADDDDVPSVATSSVAGTPHRTASATRPRGGISRGRASRGRGRGRANAIAVSAAEPPQTIFELAPSGIRDEQAGATISDIGGNANMDTVSTPIKVPRKRGKRTDGEKEKKKPGRKNKYAKPMAQVQDDAVSVAESFIGTQPSSPIIRDRDSPDVDTVLGGYRGVTDIQTAGDGEGKPAVESSMQAPLHLDSNVPIPVYRLPSKPFLVQAPPKIPSGFAQTAPLDRMRMPTRHWRLAQRAIRGIAGGQWLTRTWVGDKESAYATATGRAGGDVIGERDAVLSSLATKGSRGANGITTSISTGSSMPSPLSRSPALGPTLRLPPSSSLQSLYPSPLALVGKPPAGRSKLSTMTPLAAAESGGGSTSTSSHEGSPPAPVQVAGSLTSAEAATEGSDTSVLLVGQNTVTSSSSRQRQPSKMRHSVSAQDSEVGAGAGEDANIEIVGVPEEVDVDVVMDTT